jgi:cytochrome c-type biogenesis protein CcmH
MSRPLLATLVMAGICFGAAAQGVIREAAPSVADPALEAQVLRIAAELRCLVCQNQTLAESDASLAQDLRSRMRTMLRAGADDAEVRRYMTDRYGDFVLYRPPLKASTLPLWFGPGLLLAGGLATLFGVLRRRGRLGDAQFEPDPADAGESNDVCNPEGVMP